MVAVMVVVVVKEEKSARRPRCEAMYKKLGKEVFREEAGQETATWRDRIEAAFKSSTRVRPSFRRYGAMQVMGRHAVFPHTCLAQHA